jgi:DNA-binding response OmpR family regulator
MYTLWVRLLLVEDYPPLATVTAIALGRLGHTVVRAGDARRARATDGRFDLAIVDIELPDVNGVDLADELLAAERAARVVFYTATRDDKHRARAAKLGEVVDKNDGLEALIAAAERPPMAERAKVANGGESWLGRLTGLSGTRRRVP